MRARTAAAACLLTVGLTLTACSSGSSDKKGDGAGDASSGSSPKSAAGFTVRPKDASAAWAIIHAAVPTSKLSMTVTEANDGNHLIGRPHEYTSAIKFADSRVKASDVVGADKGDVDWGGGIEAFPSHGDAQARADYIQAIVKNLPMFSEYDYVDGVFLVRVSHYLTPTQAAEYKAAARKLD